MHTSGPLAEARPDAAGLGDPTHRLRLYVAGQTPKSLTAIANLERICKKHLAGRYTVEVIDLLKQPQLAVDDQILAIPTLVRTLPEPIKRIIGDFPTQSGSWSGSICVWKACHERR